MSPQQRYLTTAIVGRPRTLKLGSRPERGAHGQPTLATEQSAQRTWLHERTKHLSGLVRGAWNSIWTRWSTAITAGAVAMLVAASMILLVERRQATVLAEAIRAASSTAEQTRADGQELPIAVATRTIRPSEQPYVRGEEGPVPQSVLAASDIRPSAAPRIAAPAQPVQRLTTDKAAAATPQAATVTAARMLQDFTTGNADKAVAAQPPAKIADAPSTQVARLPTSVAQNAQPSSSVRLAQPIFETRAAAGAAQTPPTPAKNTAAPADAAPQALPGVTIVDIDGGGGHVLITNPANRLPVRYVVGQKIHTGEVIRSIDAASGKVVTDARTIEMR